MEEFIEKYNGLETGQVLEDVTLNVAGNLNDLFIVMCDLILLLHWEVSHMICFLGLERHCNDWGVLLASPFVRVKKYVQLAGFQFPTSDAVRGSLAFLTLPLGRTKYKTKGAYGN